MLEEKVEGNHGFLGVDSEVVFWEKEDPLRKQRCEGILWKIDVAFVLA